MKTSDLHGDGDDEAVGAGWGGAALPLDVERAGVAVQNVKVDEDIDNSD